MASTEDDQSNVFVMNIQILPKKEKKREEDTSTQLKRLNL